MRPCSDCKSPTSNKGYCSICGVKRNAVWKKENPEKYRLSEKRQSLKKRYGMTLEQYDGMFNKQNGLCATCDIHHSQLKRALCVDHDHTTGLIRGLLCDDCNIALGRIRDEKPTLSKMMNYLSIEKESLAK